MFSRCHAGTAGSQEQHPAPAAAQSDGSIPAANAESSTARAAHATAGFRDKISGYFKRSFSQTSQSIQTVLFCMHLTLVLLAVLHLQPLNRKLSQIAWVYFLQTSVLTHGYKVCFTHVASGHLSTAKCIMPLLCEFAAKRCWGRHASSAWHRIPLPDCHTADYCIFLWYDPNRAIVQG